jgi:hypothetical protein
VGFEPRILAVERGKTVHASDYAATVIGKPDVVRVIKSKGGKRGRTGEAITCLEEVRNSCSNIVEKPEFNKLLSIYTSRRQESTEYILK